MDGKEVEFGKGWEPPIELRNMRWEGGRPDGCDSASRRRAKKLRRYDPQANKAEALCAQEEGAADSATPLQPNLRSRSGWLFAIEACAA